MLWRGRKITLFVPSRLHNVRSKTITAGLLLFMFGVSAFGWCGDSSKACVASIARKTCARKESIRTPGGDLVRSSSARCSLPFTGAGLRRRIHTLRNQQPAKRRAQSRHSSADCTHFDFVHRCSGDRPGTSTLLNI